MKNCPYCAEIISDEAIKCKHCHEWLNKKNINQKIVDAIKNDAKRASYGSMSKFSVGTCVPSSGKSVTGWLFIILGLITSSSIVYIVNEIIAKNYTFELVRWEQRFLGVLLILFIMSGGWIGQIIHKNLNK